MVKGKTKISTPAKVVGYPQESGYLQVIE